MSVKPYNENDPPELPPVTTDNGIARQFTSSQLEAMMEKLQSTEKEIRQDRNVRYGTKNDCLGNVATFGHKGAIINMFECAMRLKNMFDQENPDNADMLNAIQDIRNYAAYIWIIKNRNM